MVYEPGPGEAPSPAWTSSCRALDVEPKPPAPDCVDLPNPFRDMFPIAVAECGSYEPGSPMKVSSASLPRFVLDLNADDGRPSAMPLVATDRASYAPGPGVRWFLANLALSLASSMAALAAAGVCVASYQQQGKGFRRGVWCHLD